MSGRIEEAAVRQLLNGVDSLQAVSIADKQSIKQSVLRMQPCVVILDAEAAVSNSAQVLELFDTLPQLRILLVHVESNVVEIYDKHEITLQEPSELLDAIHAAWPASSPIRS